MQNELLCGAGVIAIRPIRCLVQLSNILEPGDQSEKSPGKEDNLGTKSSNYRSLKSYKGLCAITEMAECLELSCVSAKIMFFLLELYSFRTVLQEQKQRFTSNSRSSKSLKGMLTSMRHRMLSKSNFILVSHHHSKLFSFRGTLPLLWKKIAASL